jgi:heme exporter protein A
MPADAPRDDCALELREITKYFGDLPALKRIGLRIKPGDSVLLYGPNGAGKTTLLRTLASLARPTEGQVTFCGKDLRDDPAAAKARIGFVSHATFLYGELTARENLRFAGILFGMADLENRIEAVLDLFAVRPRADELVRQLSRGLQQRVTLARALLHDPDFLLLDEPFTGLDAAAVENLQATLRSLTAQGKALIFSTHDFEQGAAVARRLIALEHGQILYDGPLTAQACEALGLPQAGFAEGAR